MLLTPRRCPAAGGGPSLGAFSALRCWTWTLRAPYYACLISGFTPGFLPWPLCDEPRLPAKPCSPPYPCLIPRSTQSQQHNRPRSLPPSFLSLFSPAPGHPSILASASCTTHVYLIFYFIPAPRKALVNLCQDEQRARRGGIREEISRKSRPTTSRPCASRVTFLRRSSPLEIA